jgi:hypothetical protein
MKRRRLDRRASGQCGQQTEHEQSEQRETHDRAAAAAPRGAPCTGALSPYRFAWAHVGRTYQPCDTVSNRPSRDRL